MTDIYGGLWFENLVAQDRHFDLQCQLFARGIIQGIQMRVAHSSYTPGVTAEDLPRLVTRLPSGMPVFIHFGAENCGVDFGQRFDECEIYARRGKPNGISWIEWNSQSVVWGALVARAFPRPPLVPHGVVHSGYGLRPNDDAARDRITDALRALDDGSRIAVENVPPIVRHAWDAAVSGDRRCWLQDEYWGIGGTPEDMARTLASLGAEWRCLIDFTHLHVACNQYTALAKGVPVDSVLHWPDRAVAAFMDLPHWPICHFSGIPPTLMDASEYMDAPVVEPIRDALQTMAIVCLEVPFRPWSAEHIITDFRTRYLDTRSMV